MEHRGQHPIRAGRRACSALIADIDGPNRPTFIGLAADGPLAEH